MTRPIVQLCVHGETKPHSEVLWPMSSQWGGEEINQCPGGRVLEQAIIIERDTDGALSPPWVREWRCWREDGSYGACDEWKIAAWKAWPTGGWSHRHMDCGWQIYAMEDALASAQEKR